MPCTTHINDRHRGPSSSLLAPLPFFDSMHRALLIVDPQYDFLPPSGSLAVRHGDSILPHVYRLLDDAQWTLVVASQDSHPPAHISFASRHGVPPFGTTTVRDPRTGAPVPQELWPDHCVAGTRGAELEDGVRARLGRWGARGTVLRKVSANPLPGSARPPEDQDCSELTGRRCGPAGHGPGRRRLLGVRRPARDGGRLAGRGAVVATPARFVLAGLSLSRLTP
ncbi:hypothetical protein JCM21900_000422 [Sporobolomyces salmonicolor]